MLDVTVNSVSSSSWKYVRRFIEYRCRSEHVRDPELEVRDHVGGCADVAGDRTEDRQLAQHVLEVHGSVEHQHLYAGRCERGDEVARVVRDDDEVGFERDDRLDVGA